MSANGRPPEQKRVIDAPARFTRHVYPQMTFIVGDLPRLLPDMAGLEINDETPTCVAFALPDGETHCFLFTQESKRELVAALTGGIAIAGPGDISG